MKSFYALLAVPALAAGLLTGSVTAPKGSQAVASSCNALTFHDERREGGVCCFTEHTHSAVGAGENSRAKALTEAVKAWEDFTWFEYGSPYERWSIAHSKSVSCTTGAGWTCTVVARACHAG